MTAYRYYLLGEDGKINLAEVVECPTDAAALEMAERRLASCGYPAIEVWDRGRRLGSVGHPKVTDDAKPQSEPRVGIAS